MKEQMEYHAFVGKDGKCNLQQVTSLRGLPDNHYDYEEPVFIPTDGILVLVEDDGDPNWNVNLTRHIASAHPELLNHRLLKAPRDPWNKQLINTDPRVVLKANRGIKAATPDVGEVVDGTFKVERCLGKGAAGSAFEVTLVRDWSGHARGKTFCLKWYSDEIFGREDAIVALKRRIREATVGSALEHPNLARVYPAAELWIDGKPQYLLMELIRGNTLEEVANQGPGQTAQVQQILLDIATALQVLHERGMLHRDVKAANVMIDTTDGHAVLLDFGVVRPTSAETMTASGAFLGTLQFSAPEWLRGEDCGFATDIYSLGTIGYHLLAGKKIFGEKPWNQMFVDVLNEKPTLYEEVWDQQRQRLAKLTLRMLEKRPEDRPTLGEVMSELTSELT